MTLENIVLYLPAFVLVAVLIIFTRAIPFFTQVPRYFAWRKFAKISGLTFVSAPFFSSIGESSPKIYGSFENRQVVISVDTHGKLGFADSFTQIVIPIQNRITSNFPKGGFLYVRRLNIKDKFFVEMQKIIPNLVLDPIPSSTCVAFSNPESLGNSIKRISEFKQVTLDKHFSGLLVREQNLYFRKKNVDTNSTNIKLLVKNLCKVAEHFEGYSLAWMK